MPPGTPRFNRGDEVIVTGGIVQRVDYGTFYDPTQNHGPIPGKGVLVSIGGGQTEWFHPAVLVLVKAAPKHKLNPGDRIVERDTGYEYLYVGGKWMCTFDHRGDVAEDAGTWDEMTIREHPERFQYFPRSEVPAPDPADQATHPADNRTEQQQ